MIKIDLKNNDNIYTINLPLNESNLKKEMREAGFSIQNTWFEKVQVQNCQSDIEYVNRCVNEFEEINIYDLNFLSKYLSKLNEQEIKEYNAILKYEYKNINDIMELINLCFEREYYAYTDGVKDMTSMADYMIKNNKKMKHLSIKEAENILTSLNITWKGVFDEYNNSNGYVGCISRGKQEKRREISKFRNRDWDGNVTIFRTDIITALGIAITGQGTLFKDKELLYTVGLNYNDLLEVYQNLTGRQPTPSITENVYERFGIIPTHLGNDRIKDVELVIEPKEMEEFE